MLQIVKIPSFRPGTFTYEVRRNDESLGMTRPIERTSIGVRSERLIVTQDWLFITRNMPFDRTGIRPTFLQAVRAIRDQVVQ